MPSSSIQATCWSIPGTDVLKQFYALPDQDRFAMKEVILVSAALHDFRQTTYCYGITKINTDMLAVS